ncbi:PH domain-containing protein [Sphingomonas sp. CJ99]
MTHPTPASLELVPLAPLERGQITVMRIQSALSALPALVGASALDWFAFDGLREATGLPPFGLLPGLILVWALYSVGPGAPRRWRWWGQAFTGTELHVASGWLTRSHTIVPVSRVQHIDVTQGPVERMCGVSTLVLHTAGTANSTVSLPGITRERAEEIRDSIRHSIGSAR